MNRRKNSQGLDLDDNGFIHNQVRPKAFLELPSLIDIGDRDLPATRDTRYLQLISQTLSINRFQESRPERTMHIDRQPDNALRQAPIFQQNLLRGPP